MRKIILTSALITSYSIANPFASPNESHGIVNLQHSQPTKGLFSVKVNQINDKNVGSKNSGLWLKPGEYTLKVSSVVPLELVNGLKSKTFNPRDTQDTISIKVEEGKSYYVAYDASSRDVKEWKPVVWKTKEL